jgi:hypothetical protein
MLKQIIIFSCILVFASRGQNIDRFFLIAEGGEKLGPFSFKDGQKITVPKGKYIMQLADTSQTAKKLRTIILPRIEFENATLDQVVRYLRHKAQNLDPEGKGIDINVRDKPQDKQVKKNADTAKPGLDEWGMSKTATNKPTRKRYIDLEMTNISMADCLTNICKLTDTNWLIENGRVIIER